MHRFFASPENITGDQVILRGADVAHIRIVLRLKSGDEICVMDGKGGSYRARLTEVRSKEVIGEIVSVSAVQTESPVAICLGQALLKGGKFDDIICKAVELGVGSIVPLALERCVARLSPAGAGNKSRRWREIALSAAKQSGRTLVPRIEPSVQSLEIFCRNNADCDLKIIFWENEGAVRLNLAGKGNLKSIAVVTGPEGGFTDAEIETARGHGFKTVTLGPRILRAETAPIAALAVLQNLFGDL